MVAHPQHASAGAQGVAAQMAYACQRFLDALTPDQRAKTVFPFADGERIFWYYPPLNRRGLPLKQMNEGQRERAFALMASALSEQGYRQARAIIAHEEILRELEQRHDVLRWDRDPGLYSFVVFGEPGDREPWGWRAEGHHLSIHFTVLSGSVVASTPCFFGANPAEVKEGPHKGLRILAATEDLAFAVVESLDAGQRSKAVVYERAPWDILTYNSSRAVLPYDEGLPASRMTGTQQETLLALITAYVQRVHTDLASEKLAKLKAEGLAHLSFAWGGPVKKGQPVYYRIYGGNFVVEFDNRQNQANHIHSVWRDVENDFGVDVLRQHYRDHHMFNQL